MQKHFAKQVLSVVAVGSNRASHVPGLTLWRHLGDRLDVVIDNPSARAWRAYWRAVFRWLAEQPDQDKVDPSVFAVIDWGLQTAEIRPGPWPLTPPPTELPWSRICNEYQGLTKGAPYLLLFAPLMGAMPVDDFGPTLLWHDLWIWPALSAYPPQDPWASSSLPSTLWRSPYRTLENAVHAFPVGFDRVADVRSASGFLTLRIPLIVDEQGPILTADTVQAGMESLSKALVALRLTFPGSLVVPSVVGILEPFTGQPPVWRWVSTAVSPWPPRDRPMRLDAMHFSEVREWKRRLDAIPWEAFPIWSFVRYEEIGGVTPAIVNREEYVAGNYLEYALVLWDLTYGRSSTAAFLNAWSCLEVLFATSETKTIKARASKVVPEMQTAVEHLAELRQSFGHGRMHGRRRRLAGHEVSQTQELLRCLMRAVLREVGRDPAKYGQRDALTAWACSLP